MSKKGFFNFWDNFEGNISSGLTVGIISSIITAFIWAGLSYLMEKQPVILFGAGVGVLVGIPMGLLGPSRPVPCSIMGGLFALITCILGDFFWAVMVLAHEWDVSFFSTLLYLVRSGNFLEVAFIDFNFMSFLIFLIAVVIGSCAPFNIRQER